LATHFAVPLGRFRVPERRSPKLACLDALDDWLPVLRRQARVKEAAPRLRNAERRLADALFAVAQHPGEQGRWQSVLLALAEVEGIQATGSGFKAGPVPRLRPEWAEAANDNSMEFRLALSLALQHGGFDADPWNTVRRHWLPLDEKKPWLFAKCGTGSQVRLQIGPEVVIQGRSGIQDAIALVERRLIEASQRGERRLPLVAAYKASAHPADLAALVAGEADLDRTLALARALMALDGRQWANNPMPSHMPQNNRQPDDAWLVIRLALLPWPLKNRHGGEYRIGTNPAIFRRLANGDAATAVELALRQLGAAGIQTAVRAATVPPDAARRWAAALAFPIHQKTAGRFLRHLDPTFIKETTI
jgi:CRISPR-associated protein Csx17